MITTTEDLNSIQQDLIDSFNRKINSLHLDSFFDKKEFIVSAKEEFKNAIKTGNGLSTARLLLNNTKIQRAILIPINDPQCHSNTPEKTILYVKSLENKQLRNFFENLIEEIKIFISKSELLQKAAFDQIINSSELSSKNQKYLSEKLSEHTISINENENLNRKSKKYSEFTISINNNNNNQNFSPLTDFNSHQKPNRTVDDFMLFDANSDSSIPMLHYCIQKNDYAIVSQFLNNPENLALLNMQDFNGNTPLLLALRNNQFEIASLLCFHYAVEARKTNYVGEAPIHVIAQFSVKNIIDVKQKQQREKEIVSYMKILFYNLTSDEKQHLLSSIYQSRTPLIIATEMENLALIQFLIEQGAAPTQADFEGNTFLHYAVCAGNLEFFEKTLDLVDHFSLKFRLLALYGEETHHIFTRQNIYGETILILAIQQENETLVKLILDRTSCLNEISRTISKTLFNTNYVRTRTALHYAVEKKNINIIQILLDKGADANITDETEKTPLHCAVQDDNLEIVKILVERGANPHQTDKHRESAIDYAKNRKEIKDYFDSYLAENKENTEKSVIEEISDFSL